MTRGKRRRAQSAETSQAKGQPCQIRFNGICNFDPQTTQPCHLRMHGISGMGYIADSWFIAYGCSACHRHADTHSDAETTNDFYRGIFRTQALRIKTGETP